DCLLGLPSKRMVPARRIPEMLGVVRQHGLDDSRIDRCRRVIIHVNGKLDGHWLFHPALFTLSRGGRHLLRLACRPTRSTDGWRYGPTSTRESAGPPRAPSRVGPLGRRPARPPCTPKVPTRSAREPARAGHARCTWRTDRTFRRPTSTPSQ